jgi:hypothetical protein
MTPRPNPLMSPYAKEYPYTWMVLHMTALPNEWRLGRGDDSDLLVHVEVFFRCPWFTMRDVHRLICNRAVGCLK